MPEGKDHREPIPKKKLLKDTTPVPNVILDEWMPQLSPAEMCVVLYVARRTRGWGREQDQISINQMMNGIVRRDGRRLDNGTGLGETACRRAVRTLVARGALKREEVVSKSGAYEPPWYRLNLSWEAEGVSESDRGRVSQSDRVEGVTKWPPGRGSESDSHKSPSLKFSPGSEDEVGEVSELVSSSQKGRENQKTPPPSSSSGNPGGHINPGESRIPSENDDEKSKNSSKSQIGAGREEFLDGERELRTAPKKSWQMVSDEIKTLPEERISEEARELSEALLEKLPRIDSARLERLALYTIESGGVSYLGGLVSSEEKKLKFKVDNPWSYLIKTLESHPYVGDENGTDYTPCERFKDAYEAGRTRYTLGGIFDKHQHEGVARRNRTPTEDYIERFE